MTETYKPGDRVQYGISAGTVEQHDQTSIVLVKLDRSATSGYIHIDLLKRQPVEPGCYVRWSDEAGGKFENQGWPVHKHRVLNVSEMPWGGKGVIAFENVPEMVYLSDVVRVADPEPVSAGISFSVNADGSSSMKIEAAQFVLSAADFEYFACRGHADDSPWHVYQHHIDGTPPRFPIYIKDSIGPFTTAEICSSVCGVLNAKRGGFQVNEQINKLAEFITAHHADKITESEGAADTAIRIMTEQASEIKSLTTNLREQSDRLIQQANTIADYMDRERLTKPHQFKRGDLVRATRADDDRTVIGRIVTTHNRTVEIMTEAGAFYSNIPLDALTLVE